MLTGRDRNHRWHNLMSYKSLYDHSCSQQKNISLNQKLLFLPPPPEVASYVLHHELIHLKVFDHSEQFWTELGKYIETPKRFRSVLLRKAEKLVPLWAGL